MGLEYSLPAGKPFKRTTEQHQWGLNRRSGNAGLNGSKPRCGYLINHSTDVASQPGRPGGACATSPAGYIMLPTAAVFLLPEPELMR